MLLKDKMKKIILLFICMVFLTSVTANAQSLGSRELKVISPNMYGNDVKQLQQFLISKGYSLPKYGVDGYYGKETEAAVKAWQKDSGLSVNGIFDYNSYQEYLNQIRIAKTKVYIAPSVFQSIGVTTNDEISQLLGFPYWVQGYYQVRISQDNRNFVVVGPYGQKLISKATINAKATIINTLAELGVKFELGKPVIENQGNYIQVRSSQSPQEQQIFIQPFWSSTASPTAKQVFVRRYVRDYDGVFSEEIINNMDNQLKEMNKDLIYPVYIVIASHNGQNPLERAQNHYEEFFEQGKIYGKYEKNGILIFYTYEGSSEGEAIQVKRRYVFVKHPGFKWGLSDQEINYLCEDNDNILKTNPTQALLNIAKYITDEEKENIPTNLILRRKIIEEARGYIGVRYVFGGNSRSGIDCSGLVVQVYHKVAGIDMPRRSTLIYEKYTNYGRNLLNKNEWLPGDVCFFKASRVSNNHVGIYSGKKDGVDYIIDAAPPKVRERPISSVRAAGGLIGCFRILNS